MKTRICNFCGIRKDISAYRKDTKGKEGYAVRCTLCKNAKKYGFTPSSLLKKEQKTFTIKPVSVNECRFTQLSKKYKSFWGLSSDKDGNARLQIFSNPVLTFRSDNVDDVIDLALRYTPQYSSVVS